MNALVQRERKIALQENSLVRPVVNAKTKFSNRLGNCNRKSYKTEEENISSKSEVLSGARAACINFPRSVRTSAKIGGEKEESS